MPNTWIEFVKSYAKDKNAKYSECLKSAECKKAYNDAKK
jgi:hypothetical protein